jgi:hypothetical protein
LGWLTFAGRAGTIPLEFTTFCNLLRRRDIAPSL